MSKTKLTKNELKKQRDSLKMYLRYLPTLMLKRQQLQMEIRIADLRIMKLRAEKERLGDAFRRWVAVFGEKGVFSASLLKISSVKTSLGNIAGVPIPVFEGAEFETSPCDMLKTPLWLDFAVEHMKQALLLDLELRILDEQRARLNAELRKATQHVNLFEKVKIPEAAGHIKKIQVYLGDQQTAAVVRGKIAKSGLAKAAQP
jgi:V/A-type H+-transporting ATPase subunit D